jgi:RNA polymerase sigma-70 factor (ECF subfamily)
MGVETADDDGDRLVRAAKSEREAFGRLFDRYHPAIHRFCQRRLYPLDGADDVVAETFLAVARGMATFPGATADDFRCWLFRIAANAANNAIRKHRRRYKLLGAPIDAAAVADGPRESPVETADEWRRVAAALEQLDHRSRTVVTLRYMEDMKHEEIARVVAARPAAVRTILSRALERLRRLLHVERISVAEDGGGER